MLGKLDLNQIETWDSEKIFFICHTSNFKMNTDSKFLSKMSFYVSDQSEIIRFFFCYLHSIEKNILDEILVVFAQASSLEHQKHREKGWEKEARWDCLGRVVELFGRQHDDRTRVVGTELSRVLIPGLDSPNLRRLGVESGLGMGVLKHLQGSRHTAHLKIQQMSHLGLPFFSFIQEATVSWLQCACSEYTIGSVD